MKPILLITFSLALLLAGCAPKGPQPLTVLTHDSFSVSENLINQFESENNVKVTFVKGGDAGSVLNKAILSKDAPLADVLYGVDNTFLSRALDAGIYSPYQAAALAGIPAEFKLDPQNRALPVDYGDVCINYDKSYFATRNLPVPQSFSDLTKPEYKGLLVVEDPSTSSPGLAFLLATIARYGDGFQDFWRQLKDNDVTVVELLGNGLLHQFQRIVRAWSPAHGGLLWFKPGRGGGLCRPAGERIPDCFTRERRHVFSSDRVRRHPQWHAQPRPC